MQLRRSRFQEYLIVQDGAGQGAQWLCTCIIVWGHQRLISCSVMRGSLAYSDHKASNTLKNLLPWLLQSPAKERCDQEC